MIRLGRISYVNMAPVFFGLEADVEEVPGVRRAERASARRRRIDPRPSRRSSMGTMRATHLPRLASRGRGRLIQLVAQAARAHRVGRRYARERDDPPFSSASSARGRAGAGEEADARLLIGDAALKSMFEDPTPHYDLGRLWLERTGLPMVYRRRVPPSGHRTHRRARAGFSRRPPAQPCGAGAPRPRGKRPLRLSTRLPRALLREAPAYRFGPRERAGLLSFFELAVEAGSWSAFRAHFLVTEPIEA